MDNVEVLESMKRIIEYMKESEGKHFEECEPAEQENHIFKDVLLVDEFISL